MALFKINSGNEENLFVNRENSNELLVPFNPGWAYFSPDTGNFFIDKPIEDQTIVVTKDNIKKYRIQLNANKADFLLKETDNAGIYEIQPEKGVLQEPYTNNSFVYDNTNIKILKTTEQNDSDKNIIFPLTLGESVYLQDNETEENINLQSYLKKNLPKITLTTWEDKN